MAKKTLENERMCDVLEDIEILAYHAKNVLQVLEDTDTADLQIERYYDLICIASDYVYQLDSKLEECINGISCDVLYKHKE